MPDAAAAAVAVAATAASSDSPCGNIRECDRPAVMSADLKCVSMQHAPTGCSAGTARRSFETSTSSHDPTVYADPMADAMNIPAGSACTTGSAGSMRTAVKTCMPGAVGISQMESTDTPPQPSPASATPSWLPQSSCQGQKIKQVQAQGQGQGSCHEQGMAQGEGQGQGQKLVQMALLVPCRKAMKDRFPLNGTFFQVNEVFLDHSSMEQPLQVLPAVWHRLMKACHTDDHIVLVTVTAHVGQLQAPCTSWPFRPVLLWALPSPPYPLPILLVLAPTRRHQDPLCIGKHKHLATLMHPFCLQALANSNLNWRRNGKVVTHIQNVAMYLSFCGVV